MALDRIREVVCLAADTSEWDAAIDAAGERVKAFAAVSETRLKAAGDTISAWNDKVAGAGKSAKKGWDAAYAAAGEGAEDFGGEVGDRLGGVIGKKLGTVFRFLGPETGAALGSILGRTAGEAFLNPLVNSIDFDGIDAAFKEMGGSTEGLRADTDAFLGGLNTTASDALDRMKKAFKDAKFGDIMKMSASEGYEAIQAKFSGLAGVVAHETGEAAGAMMLRTEEYIDNLAARFQEPLAKLADLVQSVGVAIGLVDADTQSWGDSIRDIEDAGKQAMTALAKAVGYAHDALRIAFGAFQATIVQAYIKGVGEMIDATADFVKYVEPILDVAGLGGGWTQKLAEASRELAKKVEGYGKSVEGAGMDMIAKGLQFNQAQQNADWYGDKENRERWMSRNQYDDLVKAFRKAFPNRPAGGEMAVEVPKIERTGLRVAMALQGSQEAVGAILGNERNKREAQAATLAEKVAMEQRDLARKGNATLSKIEANTARSAAKEPTDDELENYDPMAF